MILFASSTSFKKVWKYKVINEKLYKRLWNKTQNKWETEWIPV